MLGKLSCHETPWEIKIQSIIDYEIVNDSGNQANLQNPLTNVLGIDNLKNMTRESTILDWTKSLHNVSVSYCHVHFI